MARYNNGKKSQLFRDRPGAGVGLRVAVLIMAQCGLVTVLIICIESRYLSVAMARCHISSVPLRCDLWVAPPPASGPVLTVSRTV